MTRVLFTVSFWADAAERALKSAAQSAILAFGADHLAGIMSADLWNVARLAAGGAILSLLTSVGSAQLGGTVSPASLVKDANG